MLEEPAPAVAVNSLSLSLSLSPPGGAGLKHGLPRRHPCQRPLPLLFPLARPLVHLLRPSRAAMSTIEHARLCGCGQSRGRGNEIGPETR
ncbi:hypothetical protein LX36DRAFT_658313 [Colletotrichum falcatum]|nr:hypothetical protein LX36DRAFT_658313 [Colletotrichum falcatum]